MDSLYGYGSESPPNDSDKEEYDENDDVIYLQVYTGQVRYDSTQVENKEDSKKIEKLKDSEDLLLSSGEEFGDESLKKSSSRRYWKEADMSIKCFNCNDYGHMARECTNEKVLKPCILCGQTDHQRSDCPRELCYNCGKPGHISVNCSVPKNVHSKDICFNCGKTGHISRECSQTDNRRYRERRETKNERSFCYNCGGEGHIGNLCREARIDFFSKMDKLGMLHSIKSSEEKKMDVNSRDFVPSQQYGISNSKSHYSRESNKYDSDNQYSNFVQQRSESTHIRDGWERRDHNRMGDERAYNKYHNSQKENHREKKRHKRY